ncbi:hypothetical protein Tco_0691425, partial [Tanacetum coccineum]
IPHGSISNSSCLTCSKISYNREMQQLHGAAKYSISPECKIVGQILLDHPLSYALITTADVPVVYLQQLWRTVSKLPVETPENLFVEPVNIETIKVFMNKVGYQGMLIPDAFLIEEIRANDDFKEYETVFMKVDVPMNQPQLVVSTQGTHRSTPKAHRTPTLTASPRGKKRKQSAGESSSPHKSLKITIRQQKVVEGNQDDDDSENRLEPGSHKDKPEYVDDDNDKGAEKVDEEEGGEIVNQVLHLGVSQLAEKDTEELIENKLKPCIAAMIIEDRDTFRLDVPDLVSQEFNAQAPKIIEDLFKNYVQSNVIQFILPQPLQPKQLHQDDDIHSHHDDQEDDAPPEGEKRVKRHKASKSSKSTRGSSSKNSAKDSTTYVSKQQQQQQEWDAWVEETVINEDEEILADETPELITEVQDVDKLNAACAQLQLLSDYNCWKGEYEMWKLRIEQYFQVKNYALWDVIENGSSFKPVARTTINADGTSTSLIPGLVTIDEKTQKKNDVKARSMLLMTLPNEHLLTFNQYKDAKTLFAAIQTRFGGNNAIKKTQKTLLKQILLNKRSKELQTQAQVLRTWVLCHHPAVLMRLIVIMKLILLTFNFNPASTQVSTASTQVSTTNLIDVTVYAFFSNQPNGPQLVHEDIEQTHEDDLEEMDLKWQLALLSMRTRRFFQKTGRKITINGSDTAGYDKSKVEFFNCHKLRHFARECRGSRKQDSRNWNQDSSKRTINVEDTSSKAMLAIDGADSERGLASVEEQLVFYKKNEVLFCEQIAVLKRDISYKDSEISELKSELEKLKQEKESNQLKIENFDNASKRLFAPPTLDLSNSGLEEFQQPEFEGYGPKISKSVSEDVSNDLRKTPDAPLVEELVQELLFNALWKDGLLFDSSSNNANNDEPQPSNDAGKKDDEGRIDNQERPEKSA